jgi:hypothetical protein
MMGTLGGARPDFATEAMGINEGDTYLILCPMSTWKRFQTKEELIAALDKALSGSARHRLRFHAAHGHPYRRTVSGRQSGSGHQSLRRQLQHAGSPRPADLVQLLNSKAGPNLSREFSQPPSLARSLRSASSGDSRFRRSPSHLWRTCRRDPWSPLESAFALLLRV